MAVDEALVRACVQGEEGFPCVRFYAWEPACLSLGFHQDAAAAAEAAALAEMGIDLVRRPTGGRAVLHDLEVTYSVVASCRSGPLAGPVMTGYRRISEALIEGLQRLGLAARLAAGDPDAGRWSAEPCFARPSASEVEVDGLKLVGSVQLRHGGCLLQHGSIPIRFDAARLARATGANPVGRVRGLADLLGGAPATRDVTDALAAGFVAAFGVDLRPGSLTAGEAADAAELTRSRYQTDQWNLGRPRRRLGAVA